MNDNFLRDVNIEGFRLRMWDSGQQDKRGTTTIAYLFQDKNSRALFKGCDFNGSPLHADDSNECVRSLLSFLTLRPGDTDAEYFENYTADQLDFADTDAENLSLYAMEPEEGFEPMPLEDWKD